MCDFYLYNNMDFNISLRSCVNDSQIQNANLIIVLIHAKYPQSTKYTVSKVKQKQT